MCRSPDRIPDRAHIENDGVVPGAKSTAGVHRPDPALGGLGLHVHKRVIAFGFQDQVAFPVARQPDEKIRQIVVMLAVVQVGDSEAKAPRS